jgi:hypothetical protein
LSQFRESQSLSSSQEWPLPQLGAHVGGTQTLFVHVSDAQSPLLAHDSASRHVGLQTGGTHA